MRYQGWSALPSSRRLREAGRARSAPSRARPRLAPGPTQSAYLVSAAIFGRLVLAAPSAIHGTPLPTDRWPLPLRRRRLHESAPPDRRDIATAEPKCTCPRTACRWSSVARDVAPVVPSDASRGACMRKTEGEARSGMGANRITEFQHREETHASRK